MNSHKVLFVLTSHDQLGNTGKKTGFYLEEFVTPYYHLADQGVQITLASPKGGQPPCDPNSEAPDAQTETTKRFNQDAALKEKLSKTVKLSEVKADDYDAIFYPGGHGPLWDLAEDPVSIKLIETFWAQKKPVASVCHGPIVLKGAKDQNGEPLVKGKKVTGFTNDEEAEMKLTDVVPCLIEDVFKGLGADYQKKENWTPFVQQDGLLITGQNQVSPGLVADALLATLKK